MSDKNTAYEQAQHALADLKAAVYRLLTEAGADGLKNSEIGHALGINRGHSGPGRHEGHIPRLILDIMNEDGTVEQVQATKTWRLK